MSSRECSWNLAVEHTDDFDGEGFRPRYTWIPDPNATAVEDDRAIRCLYRLRGPGDETRKHESYGDMEHR
jgi:hypothetical protein